MIKSYLDAISFIFDELQKDTLHCVKFTSLIEEYSAQPELGYQRQARIIASILPVVILCEAFETFGKAVACSVLALPLRIGGLLGINGEYTHLFSLQVQAWRVMRALALLSAAPLTAFSIPFALFKPTLVVKECDMLGLRREWSGDNQALLPTHISSQGQPLPTVEKAAPWYRHVSSALANGYRNHRTAVHVAAYLGACVATAAAGYYGYEVIFGQHSTDRDSSSEKGNQSSSNTHQEIGPSFIQPPLATTHQVNETVLSQEDSKSLQTTSESIVSGEDDDSPQTISELIANDHVNISQPITTAQGSNPLTSLGHVMMAGATALYQMEKPLWLNEGLKAIPIAAAALGVPIYLSRQFQVDAPRTIHPVATPITDPTPPPTSIATHPQTVPQRPVNLNSDKATKTNFIRETVEQIQREDLKQIISAFSNVLLTFDDTSIQILIGTFCGMTVDQVEKLTWASGGFSDHDHKILLTVTLIKTCYPLSGEIQSAEDPNSIQSSLLNLYKMGQELTATFDLPPDFTYESLSLDIATYAHNTPLTNWLRWFNIRKTKICETGGTCSSNGIKDSLRRMLVRLQPDHAAVIEKLSRDKLGTLNALEDDALNRVQLALEGMTLEQIQAIDTFDDAAFEKMVVISSESQTLFDALTQSQTLQERWIDNASIDPTSTPESTVLRLHGFRGNYESIQIEKQQDTKLILLSWLDNENNPRGWGPIELPTSVQGLPEITRESNGDVLLTFRPPPQRPPRRLSSSSTSSSHSRPPLVRTKSLYNDPKLKRTLLEGIRILSTSTSSLPNPRNSKTSSRSKKTQPVEPLSLFTAPETIVADTPEAIWRREINKISEDRRKLIQRLPKTHLDVLKRFPKKLIPVLIEGFSELDNDQAEQLFTGLGVLDPINIQMLFGAALTFYCVSKNTASDASEGNVSTSLKIWLGDPSTAQRSTSQSSSSEEEFADAIPTTMGSTLMMLFNKKLAELQSLSVPNTTVDRNQLLQDLGLNDSSSSLDAHPSGPLQQVADLFGQSNNTPNREELQAGLKLCDSTNARLPETDEDCTTREWIRGILTRWLDGPQVPKTNNQRKKQKRKKDKNTRASE